jgi:pSer/pThr/pTyr-binding forkhead associated (FHA) protein
MADLILEIVEGKEAGRQIPLTGAVDIGRDQSAQLAVDDTQVSRRHARIAPQNGNAVVEDLGSTNGTYVNDQPIQAPRELNAGDRIRMGLTVIEIRNSQQVQAQPSAVRPVPDVTAVGREVLQPVNEEELPPVAPAAPGVPSFLVDETEPAYVPSAAIDAGSPDPNSPEQQAVARLIDKRAKRQTNLAAFALLTAAGLAVAIFFGVK